jgi:hypothetical protein
MDNMPDNGQKQQEDHFSQAVRKIDEMRKNNKVGRVTIWTKNKVVYKYEFAEVRGK